MNETNKAAAPILIEAAPVERDEGGNWWHPGMPDFDEGQNDEWNAWIAEQGLEISRGMLEDCPDDHPVRVEYFENGASSFLDWVDEPPAGEGWFTLAIQDTEDGPVWCWARRIGSTVAPAPTEQAELPLGAHHLTPDSIQATIADLRGIAAGNNPRPIEARDWRTWASVLALIIEHLSTARQAPDTRNIWTDEQRKNHRANKALVYRCPVCCVKSGEAHFPGCSNDDTSGLPG